MYSVWGRHNDDMWFWISFESSLDDAKETLKNYCKPHWKIAEVAIVKKHDKYLYFQTGLLTERQILKMADFVERQNGRSSDGDGTASVGQGDAGIEPPKG